MPTGYTYPVVEGKICEFGDFAMSCARAFGALVTMRDEAQDAPIPEEFKPAAFYAEHLDGARNRLAELRAMTPEQAESAAQAAYDDAVAYAARYEARCREENARLDAMLAKVSAWAPPTVDHVGLKDFMIEQLSISKNGTYKPETPERLSGRDWLQEQLAQSMKEVGWRSEELAKEEERTRGRTEWVKSLRESLRRGL